MSEGEILQDIDKFVVAIRHSKTDEIVGTGFVAKEGIITCAHVAKSAGIDPHDQDRKDLGIYYPEREDRPSASRRAKINGYFPNHDDDVVLLQIVGGLSPLEPGSVAKIGPAQGSENHDFSSFGYRKLGDIQGLPAGGKIIGYCDKPVGEKMHGKPLKLKSSTIGKGMSGAPVLDKERNLIVGIIYISRNPTEDPRNRDTRLAVDARVLSFRPLGLHIEGQYMPKDQAPEPKFDIAKFLAAVASHRKTAWDGAPISLNEYSAEDPRDQDTRLVVDMHKDQAPEPKFDIANFFAAVASRRKIAWDGAPISLDEWTGRDQLLDNLTSSWVDSRTRIIGLIGFGGEGKSSLAKRWVEDLIADKSLPRPDGIFWWGFYKHPNIDEFFNETIKYLIGREIDRELLTVNEKIQFIGEVLRTGRYLFVLDGLEVQQYQKGDMYGSIQSSHLRTLIKFFGSSYHNSFCLITSRAPITDLIRFDTYKHLDVDRLNTQDGRNLLKNMGIQGEDENLDKVVEDWDGHALTLSLIASFLRDFYRCNISYVKEIPSPTNPDELRYERVNKVLMQYDKHLTNPEKAFLMLFSAFRKPVERDALDAFRIFQTKPKKRGLPLFDLIIALNNLQFESMLKRLIDYRILMWREPDQYIIHPLIRDYYYEILTKDHKKQAKEAHNRIKDYYKAKYLERSLDMPDKSNPSLKDLIPLIEAIHHTCRYGAYITGLKLCWKHIYRKNSFYIHQKLGAWDTLLEILSEFFLDGDIRKEPIVKNSYWMGWILNDIGKCKMSLGDGNQAKKFYTRALEIGRDPRDITVVHLNLSELYCCIGELSDGFKAAEEAQRLAGQVEKAEEKEDIERYSLAFQAWIWHLQGKMEKAIIAFQKVEELEKQRSSSKLGSKMTGVPYAFPFYADHLMRYNEANETERAQTIANSNLAKCQGENLTGGISRCYRIFGDLYTRIRPEDALMNYISAIENARSVSNKPVLIEALLARGRWYAKIKKDHDAAFSDLDEALKYAKAGGYRLYEADIRIGLAWAHLVAGDKSAAMKEANYAMEMSQDMGYHWGEQDAKVLKEMVAK